MTSFTAKPPIVHACLIGCFLACSSHFNSSFYFPKLIFFFFTGSIFATSLILTRNILLPNRKILLFCGIAAWVGLLSFLVSNAKFSVGLQVVYLLGAFLIFISLVNFPDSFFPEISAAIYFLALIESVLAAAQFA